MADKIKNILEIIEFDFLITICIIIKAKIITSKIINNIIPTLMVPNKK